MEKFNTFSFSMVIGYAIITTNISSGMLRYSCELLRVYEHKNL